VVFDKTGTLTTGEMMVDAVHGDENGLALAAAVEAHSSHPVAGAIETAASHGDAAAATAADGGAPAATAVDHHPGAGVVGRVADRRVAVGSQRLVQLEDLAVPEALAARAEDAMAAGNLPVYVGWAGDVKTVIVVRDAPRSNWEAVVTALAAGAREVLVMTGDDRRAVARFEAHEGIDEVFADVRPEAKAAVVEGLRERGTVAMVGDGSNDAPALATADLGIALGSGTALASDAADVVVTSGLAGVPRVFDLATAARRRMRSNLGWAFLYNAVAVPVAAAGLLNPLVAAVAMASSSLLVVTNSARAYAVDGGSEQAAGGDADASDRRTHTQDSPPGRDAPRPE
jgi:Cu2+-exporting ATPase